MIVESLLRLSLAALLTGFIGLDRELRSKPAGLRTNIVVGTATAAFAFVGAEAFDGGDPTRVAAQIVSGIGFLGGGAIFAAGGKPHGLTTAAALWGSAAVGLACGVAAYDVAVVLVVVTLLALWPLDLLSARLLDRFARKAVHAELVLEDLGAYAAVQDAMREAEVHAFDLHVREIGGQPLVEMTLSGRPQRVSLVLGQLRGLAGVRAIASSDIQFVEE